VASLAADFAEKHHLSWATSLRWRRHQFVEGLAVDCDAVDAGRLAAQHIFGARLEFCPASARSLRHEWPESALTCRRCDVRDTAIVAPSAAIHELTKRMVRSIW
jgi:hypothetical protein